MKLAMEMAEGEERILADALDIIRFTEGVSAKLHRALNEAQIFQVVAEEFAKSERWSASILLLADDSKSLRLAQTSMPPSKLAVLEKATGLTRDYPIRLSKAKTFRQVIMEGKSVHANVSRTIKEFLPRPIAYLISKTMDYDNQFCVLTPIKRQRKVIGILAVSCADLCEYLAHSVENLALHISTALELAQKRDQRDRAVQALKQYHEHLGELVEKRTAELKAANERLRQEVAERKQAEEAVTIERNKLQSLVDAMEYGITIQDKDFNIIYQNEPSRRAYGSHIGEKCYRVYAQRETVCEGCLVKKAFKDGKSRTWERRGTLPSGEYAVWENTANPIRDAKGKIVACLEITRNITERKRIEEALKESQEFSSSLLEGSPNPILVIDPDTSVRYVNPAFEKLTGFTQAEIAGLKAPHPWWPEEHKEEMLAALKRAMAKGGRRSVRLFKKKNGEPFWVEMTSSFVMRDGKPAYFVINWLDITERKKAEEALTLQQAHFRQLFDNSPDAVALLDTANKVVEVNKGFEQLFGYQLAEAKGQDIVDLVAPEDRLSEIKSLTRVAHAGKVVRKETVRRRKDGSLVDVSLLRYPIQLNGNLVGTYVIYTDITKRKQAEEALKESEEKYKTLLESILDGLCVIDAETRRILMANGVAARMYGLRSPQEAVGRDILDFIAPEERVRAVKVIVEEMFQKDLRRVHEWRTIAKDGREVWVSAVGARIQFQGRLAGLISFRDITERKLKEKDYHDIIHTTTDGFWIVDSAGRFLDVNDAYCTLTGYSREELLKMSIADVEAIEKPEEIAERIRRIIKTGHDRFETRHRCKNGKIIDVEISTTYAGAQDGRLFVFARDITERKRAAEALQIEKNKLESVITAMRDSLAIQDRDFNIIYQNEPLEQTYGNRIGEKCYRVYEGRDSVCEGCPVEQAFRDGQHHTVERKVVLPSGEIGFYEITANPIRDAKGEITSCLEIIRNITERKKMEEALQIEKNKLESIVATMPDLLTIQDKDFNILYQNAASQRVGGNRIGEKCYRVYEGRDSVCEGCPVEQAFRDGQTHTREAKVILPWGEISFWETTATPIRDAKGEITSCLEIVHNVTESKKREQLQRDENYVLTLLGQGAELGEVLDAIARLIESNDPTVKASIQLLDPAKGLLFQVSAPSLPDDYKELFQWGLPVGPNIGSCGRAAYLKQRVIVPDIASSPLFTSSEEVIKRATRNGLLSSWSEPIISSKGEVLGTIANYGTKVGEPSADNLRVLEWAARIAAIAIERKRAEEALRFQEAHFRQLFDNSPDAIAWLDANDRFVNVNKGFERLFGYTIADVKGQLINETIVPEDRKEEAAKLSQAALENEMVRTETVRKRKDGSLVDVSLVGYPIWLGEQPVGAFVVYTDITERKRAEQALKESERFSSSLLRSAPNPISVVNPDLSIRYVNPAFEKLTGFTLAEVIGMKPPYPWWPEGAAERIIASLKHSLEHGGRRSGTEWNFRKKNGERFWVTARSAPVVENGKPVYLIINWIETTERRQAEEALRESERFSSSLLKSAPNPITVVELDTTIKYVNPAFEKLTGFSAEEVIGIKAPYPWWPEGGRERILAAFKDAIEKGGRRTERIFQKKNGESFWVEINSAPVLENGNPVYMIVTWLDITERKKAEEKEKQLRQELFLAQRLASIGELAAGVAHEINNPLTGVLGFSQRLLRKSTDGEIRRDLEIIHGEARRAADVVQNLLTFARRRQPRKEPVNINDVLKKALELRSYAMQTHNIEVVTSLSPNLPKVMADFAQMQEAFLNIILNAEQAMSETNGRGKLTIRTQKVKDFVRISFTDDGPGIAPENIDKVFDPFFTTRAERGGTGLGLSACHGIVTEHGGRIYVRSKPGEGATFFVELPLPATEVNQAP